MRITTHMAAENAIQHMSDNMSTISKLQNQVTTGKAFQNPSEDPVNSSSSLSLRSNLRSLTSYVDTTDSAKDWMNTTDYSFEQMETLANRAISLVTRGVNDTIADSDRAASLGKEMQTLVTQALEIGNTKQNGQYIFSGYQVNTKPFSLANDTTQATYTDFSGNTGLYPQKVIYNGDTGSMQRSLGPDQTVQMNVTGDQALQTFFQNLVTASETMTKNPYDSASLQSSLGKLQSSLTTMDQYRTSNGARLRQVESAADFLTQVKTETSSLLSKKEDANVAEGMVMLATQQTTYQAVLEVSKRAISTLSLFDYLQ